MTPTLKTSYTFQSGGNMKLLPLLLAFGLFTSSAFAQKEKNLQPKKHSFTRKIYSKIDEQLNIEINGELQGEFEDDSLENISISNLKISINGKSILISNCLEDFTKVSGAVFKDVEGDNFVLRIIVKNVLVHKSKVSKAMVAEPAVVFDLDYLVPLKNDTLVNNKELMGIHEIFAGGKAILVSLFDERGNELQPVDTNPSNQKPSKPKIY